MQDNVKESIWADGIPATIKDEFKMGTKDLLTMAVNFLCENVLKKDDIKIERASADPTQLPNVIFTKNEKVYGVTIVPFLFPKYGYINDKARIGVTKLLNEKNAVSLFCPIGFKSVDEERAKAELALKGDLFNIMYRGFMILNAEETQDLVQASNFVKEL